MLSSMLSALCYCSMLFSSMLMLYATSSMLVFYAISSVLLYCMLVYSCFMQKSTTKHVCCYACMLLCFCSMQKGFSLCICAAMLHAAMLLLYAKRLQSCLCAAMLQAAMLETDDKGARGLGISQPVPGGLSFLCLVLKWLSPLRLGCLIFKQEG